MTHYLIIAALWIAAFNLGAAFAFWWAAMFRPFTMRNDDDETGIGA